MNEKTNTMKIYIDVTETYVNKLGTGIQRVVREVARHAVHVGARRGVEVIPVVAYGPGYFQLSDGKGLLSPRPSAPGAQGVLFRLEQRVIRTVKWLLRGVPSLYRLGSAVLYRVKRMRDVPEFAGLQRVRAESGEIVLLLDSYWGRGGERSLAAAAKAKYKGATVVAVVYDLIPITHPQYYDAPLVNDFTRALHTVCGVVAGIVGISKAVVDELERRIDGERIPERLDYFHLGADFHGAGSVATQPVLPWPTGLWLDGVPVFIMVGTIEPRKGHAFVLDAFETAWRKGYAGKLLIVGRVGWKTDELVKRIKSSSEFGGRLFMLNEADDQMLGEAYRRAHACIIASYVEGFGLPLVEALQRGIPVLASDIPVFREIAGEHAIYFSHKTPDTLVQAINTLEGGYSAQVEKLKKFRWLTWEESTEQLLTKVVQMAASINSTQSGTHSH